MPKTASRASRGGALAAAVAGNALEFYDFLAYTFFAVYIGRAFFPASNAFTTLLLSLATFGVGFVTRPLGSVILGAYADRAGRRPALTLTIGLMAVGSLAIAVTPGYASIGLVAPVVLVLARLVQGFALGGEFGAATAFLLETARPGGEGRATSWQTASQGIGVLGGGICAVVLAALLDERALAAWGWRVPFALGLLIVPVGLYIRRGLPETLDSPGEAAGVLRELWTGHRRALVLCMLVVLCLTVGAYVSNYMATFGIATLGMPAADAMWAGLAHGVAMIVGALLGGRLCDRFGARPVMIVPRLVLMAALVPAFLLLARAPGLALLAAVTALVSLLNLTSAAAATAAMAQAFPKRVRGAGLAIAYGISVSVFGGSTQFAVAWLGRALDDPLAPAYYLMAASVISLWAMWRLTAARAPLRSPVSIGVA